MTPPFEQPWSRIKEALWQRARAHPCLNCAFCINQHTSKGDIDSSLPEFSLTFLQLMTILALFTFVLLSVCSAKVLVFFVASLADHLCPLHFFATESSFVPSSFLCNSSNCCFMHFGSIILSSPISKLFHYSIGVKHQCIVGFFCIVLSFQMFFHQHNTSRLLHEKGCCYLH